MKSPAPRTTPIFLQALALGTVAALSLTGCKPSEEKPQAALVVAALTNFVPDQPKAAPDQPKMEIIEQIVKKATPDQLSWDELIKRVTIARPPKEWNETPPTREEIKAFEVAQAASFEKNAGIVREFIKAHPTHPKITDAKLMEFRFALGSVQGGREALKDRVISLADERIAMASVNDQEKFQLELVKVEMGMPAADREDSVKSAPILVKATRALRLKYPGNEAANEFLMRLTYMLSSNEEILALVKDVLASTSAESTKLEAEELIKKLDRVGKPLDIQFTSLDNRRVSLQEMKGKVVLVDFWATWCGPCMAGIPELKGLYAKLNPKGFEIIGINRDYELNSLLKAVKAEGLSWPQAFDAADPEKQISEALGVKVLPTLWLVDKKGNLRDLNAGAGLEAKVEKLLNEK